ncbi:F0F1-type ATP synthase subunit delta [Secundilactobacillus oryzae JCM 18671]|uniref:ATP synthase subunit delta n=1 Tax=Secundilactobacillus oryzae JCM 18671 TaxID=1291743 RepID=A0A081BIT6_9LACO|nr:ATP synthase F1 subunit delta [Secundilactobacillus oryzae]GAK47954.1 F0F1-type ATP synthase subunit delta [Secundilactobacillus oryzae JCM 18671]
MSLDEMTVAKRYSKALFEVLTENNELDSGYEELKQIRLVFQDNPQLGAILSGAALSETDRTSLVTPIIDNVDSKYVKNFMKMAFDYGRMNYLVSIIDQFEVLYNEKNQTIHAEVITAVSLDEAQEKRLADEFGKRVGAKQVILKSKVDENILGGVVMKSAGKIFDGSLQTKLAQIRRTLLG